MLERHAGREPMDDIEALIRSACDYVQVSRDLRPRVLETARAQRAEQRALRRVWQVAMLIVLAGLFSMSARERTEPINARWSAAAADADSFSSSSSSPSGASGDSAWRMVESFTEMRRRQAELLRLAL